jgi:ATPase subunit of ABC transporter with duplicated ATPase domains
VSEEDGHKLAELEGVIAEEDGYEAEAQASELLQGLGIANAWHEQPMKGLAGGLKLRVLLAQALFGNPQGLLLDEPTNNLDLDSIRWLERFLHDFEGVLVTISHDRHFLNAICTHIADIDYETIITATGSSRRTPRRRRRSSSSRSSWPASRPGRAPPRCRAARVRSRS